METRILTVTDTCWNGLSEAARILRNGGLVAFPTETVYGLGAVCTDDDAMRRVFAVKGRPGDNPLILHIWRVEQLPELAAEICPKALRLIEAFWPGPLTIIFPKRPSVSTVATAGLDTVAVRMPSHPVAHELLRLTDIPVAAPSANLSGKPSPTKGSHVVDDLAGKIEMIIDAGSCNAGIESTVLTLAVKHPLILRPGSVTREMLQEVLGEMVEVSNPAVPCERPQAPGMKYRHYAPQAPAFLIEGADNRKVVAHINHLLASAGAEKPGLRQVVLGTTENLKAYDTEFILDLGSRHDPAMVAARIYDLLRFCDQLAADIIYIEGISAQGVGLAVANRLYKAAGGNVIHVS